MQVSHDELGARLERLRASGPLDRPLLVRVPEHVYYLTGFERRVMHPRRSSSRR